MLKPADYLSLFRLFSSPVFAYFFSLYGFLFLVLTDWLDGVLARKFGSTSFGAWLDPLADKVFIWSYYAVLLSFIPRNAVFASALFVLFLGDVFSTLERTVGYKASKNVEANWFGKFKMAFQCAAMLSFFWTTIVFNARPVFSDEIFWSIRTSNLGFLFLGMALWSMSFSIKEKCRQWRE